jgi:hypothetical protein
VAIPDLLVRGVDDDLVQALKKRAGSMAAARKRNCGRSLPLLC